MVVVVVCCPVTVIILCFVSRSSSAGTRCPSPVVLLSIAVFVAPWHNWHQPIASHLAAAGHFTRVRSRSLLLWGLVHEEDGVLVLACARVLIEPSWPLKFVLTQQQRRTQSARWCGLDSIPPGMQCSAGDLRSWKRRRRERQRLATTVDCAV